MKLRNALLARLPKAGDDEGSIVMLMVVIIVSMALGTMILAMVINQDTGTRFDSSRLRALNGAQAGVDVMLGQIRNATSVDVNTNATYGDANKLPCGTMAGSANGTGVATYSVSVSYYLTDPTKTAATPMRCVPGYGPYDSATNSHTPYYATITSTGVESTNQGSSVGRTMQATYVLKNQLNQVKGGLLKVNGYCLAAQSQSPGAGTTVTLQNCDATNPAQLWAYNTDLSISLAATATLASKGMCIDAGATLPASGATTTPVLQPCSTSPPYPQQMFAVAAGPYFMATNPDGRTRNNEYNGDLSNVCLTAGSAAGSVLTLGNSVQCATIAPDASAGAGPAGPNTAQLVNYAQFGHCLDVAGSNYPGYMIGYTCTVETPVNQTPGNERWHYGTSDPAPTLTTPTTGSIWSYRLSGVNPNPPLTPTDSNQKFCLTSPGYVGGTVSMTSCSNASIAQPPSNQTWTVYRTASATGTPLSYSASYKVVDSSGLCMTDVPSGNPAADSIVLQACSSSLFQKWNADPNVLNSAVQNVCEFNNPSATKCGS